MILYLWLPFETVGAQVPPVPEEPVPEEPVPYGPPLPSDPPPTPMRITPSEAEPLVEAPGTPMALSPLATLRSYKMGRLRRGSFQQIQSGVVPFGKQAVPVVTSTMDWMVFDGGGAPMSATEFADRTADRAILEQIRADRQQGLGYFVGGLAIIGLGTTMLGARAFGDLDTEDPVLLFGGLGTMLLVGLPVSLVGGAKAKQSRSIKTYYTVDEVDAQIVAHNEALRLDLGLTEAAVWDIELQD